MGALCADGDPRTAVVVASDRMVTFPGIIEFEHAIPKMTVASTKAVMLVAGDALVGARLARDVVADPAVHGLPVAGLTRALTHHYAQVRQEEMETQLLASRGLTMQSFYAQHAALQGQVVFGLDQALAQYNLGVEVLVAGVDDDGAHLFTVHNPGGTERQHDFISYAAIGSGWLHAIQSMIGFAHTDAQGLNETVFRVYASKRRAEVAPGVGHDTDMVVIRGTGVERLSDETLTRLGTLYEEYETSVAEKLADKIGELDLQEVAGHAEQ